MLDLYKGVSKETKETIKGNLIKVGRKCYIVKFKNITRYMYSDCLRFDGGSKKYEVDIDTIEKIV